MKFMATKMSSDPAQNYSQHVRNQKGENPCMEEGDSNSIKETCAHPMQVNMVTRKLVRTISAIFPVIFVQKNYHYYERKKVDCY